MSDNQDTLPTSFGTLKPVGYVMVGAPSAQQLSAVCTGLLAAGWTPGSVSNFAPADPVSELESLIANASGLAGFGYEITLMRRYLGLAREGCEWLLVKVDDEAGAEHAADIARTAGAVLAVHYRNLTVEELL